MTFKKILSKARDWLDGDPLKNGGSTIAQIEGKTPMLRPALQSNQNVASAASGTEREGDEKTRS